MLSHCLHKALSLHWAQMSLKLVRLNEAIRVTHQVILTLIVLARGKKGALWAPVVVKKVALKVHGRVFKFFKSLGLKELPHFFFGDIVTLFYEFSLIFIQDDGSTHVLDLLFLTA